LKNLDEMDSFLDTYQVPKLKHNKINHLNSAITTKEMKAVINNLPTKKKKKKIPGPDGLSKEFYQTFKEGLIPILFIPQNRNRKSTTQFIL
jgi:hypothetical protein